VHDHARELLRAHDGVLSLRRHPRAVVNTLLAAERIVRVHPGVFVDAEMLWSRQTRYAAALVARPAALLWGDSAVAAITADPRPFNKREMITLAQPKGSDGRGLVIVRRRVPPDLVRHVHGLRCPAPALVAVEAAGRDDGKVAELFLREGLVRPDELSDAVGLFSRTREQCERRRVVVSFADNPWSGGERELQAALRRGGITGWVANPRLRIGEVTCYPDLLFESQRLAVEFDGFAVHGSREAFEADRVRQNRLMLAGYRCSATPGAGSRTIRTVWCRRSGMP